MTCSRASKTAASRPKSPPSKAALAAIAADFKAAETNLSALSPESGDCEAAYREASGTVRRQFNLAFFKRLLIDDDYTVTGELAEPFDVILGEDLRRAVIAQESEELTEAIEEAQRRRTIQGGNDDNEQRPREPEQLLVGATEPPTSSFRGGFSLDPPL